MNKQFKNKLIEAIEGTSILDIDYKLEKQEKDRKELLDNLFDGYDVLLEDYLARSRKVVVKNIKVDKLNKIILNKLLKLEKKTKDRKEVLKAIKVKLYKSI